MADVNQFHEEIFDEFTPKKKMPDMLNVLTILTFVWSGYLIIQEFISYFTICSKAAQMATNPDANVQKAIDKGGIIGSFVKEGLDISQRACEVKLANMLVGLVLVALCIAGAIMMRKLKKTGFFLYLIGEIGSPLAFIAMFGTGIIATTNFIFPVLFIILYATQIKHLTK